MRRARAGDSNDATANFWPDGESKRGAKHHNMPLRVQHMYQYLSQPVHASSLSVFRILFSICMYKQAQYFRDMFDEFEQSILVLPYPGLGWITPVGPSTGEFLLALNRYAAIFVGLGFCTEIATVVLATTFTYLFVLCESNHNNHYILICHVTALASLTCWGRWASVDYVLRIFRHRRSSRGQLLNPPPDVTIPYWNLLLFQFIFSVPYFYGAIAKMNEDWLFNAQPLKIWFGTDRSHTRNLPSNVGEAWWFPWFLAWGGFLFDLGIVPMLFLRHLRILSFPAAISFNCMNKLMFNIGIFPYAMLGSLSLFVEPDFFARLPRLLYAPEVEFGRPVGGAECARLRWHPWLLLADFAPLRATQLQAHDEVEDAERERKAAPAVSPLKQMALVGYVFCFFTFHALWPLRHFVLYPRGVSWHEEGHLHAWHMKLRTKRGWVNLMAEEANGDKFLYRPTADPFVASGQLDKIEVRPHALLLYTAAFARIHMMAGRNLTAIRPLSCFSLNGRPSAPLYGPPNVDLLDYVGSYELIPPFGGSAVGKWLTPMPAYGESSLCDNRHDMVHSSNDGMAQINAFVALYKQAGIKQMHKVVAPDGTPAYTKGWYKVDAELAAWLDSRRKS